MPPFTRYLPFLPFIVIAIILSVFVYQFAQTDLQGRYREDNRIMYFLHTDSDIRGVPRISDDFYFDYSRGDNDTIINSITFTGTTRTGEIGTYLNTLGYEQVLRRLDGTTLWEPRKGRGKSYFQLETDTSADAVRLTKTRR